MPAVLWLEALEKVRHSVAKLLITAPHALNTFEWH
jgi:hypothetical protein